MCYSYDILFLSGVVHLISGGVDLMNVILLNMYCKCLFEVLMLNEVILKIDLVLCLVKFEFPVGLYYANEVCYFVNHEKFMN